MQDGHLGFYRGEAYTRLKSGGFQGFVADMRRLIAARADEL